MSTDYCKIAEGLGQIHDRIRVQQQFTRQALDQYWASPTAANAEALQNTVAYGDVSQESIGQFFDLVRGELCPSFAPGVGRTCHYSPTRECTDGWVRDGEWCCYG